MTLCIFNPEHDLCLANGGRNYVPPGSALQFAYSSAHLMQRLYPGAHCTSVPELSTFNSQLSTPQVIPWGWNLALKTALLKAAFPESAMPSDGELQCWRELQHRGTLLPLQPDCVAATSEQEVRDMIARHHAVVLKAPWSGAGRGLRWVTGAMSAHDVAWLHKMVREQRCVIVEPRRAVTEDFALEYIVGDDGLRFVGYSLFQTAGGVYRGNELLPDDVIQHRVRYTDAQRRDLEAWLTATFVGRYRGPLGVDMMLAADGTHHLAELNLRHTMGMVAHGALPIH